MSAFKNAQLAKAEAALTDAEQKFFAFNKVFDPRTGAIGALESPRGQKLFAALIAARVKRDALLA